MRRKAGLVAFAIILLLAQQTQAALFTSQSSVGTTTSGGATSLSIPKPSGAATGHLLLAFVIVNSATTTVSAPTPNTWSALTAANAVSGSLAQFVFYRWATAAEDANYVFTFNAAAKAVGTVVSYRGVEPSSPFGSVQSQAATSATITAPAVSTTQPDEVLVASFALLRNAGTIADPAPAMTVRAPASGTLSSSGGGAGTHANLRIFDTTAASTGTQPSYVATASGSGANVGTIISLRPTPDLTFTADPVGSDGAQQSGASWGAWSAQPGSSLVASQNHLKITNTGVTTLQPFVVSFSSANFTGVSQAGEVIAINGNIQFDWCEDTTPATSSPSECTFTFARGTSATGSISGAFSGLGNIVYVTYRIVALPDPLVDQSYQASFTITEA